jgi:HK97 family phage prohead protease
MPYPNEHAARVMQPSEFTEKSFRRKNIARGIVLIVGKLKDGTGEMVEQAYRFNVRYFTALQAKDWLKDNNVEYISFEPASVKTEDNSSVDNSEIRIQTELKNELRCFDDRQCSFRSVMYGEQLEPIVDGIGIVYNSMTELFPGFYESIEPGAFSESLSDYNTVKSFINHNSTKILSTTRSKPSLEIYDGDDFMEFSAPIPPTTYGEDLIVNLKRGNINGASFSFMIKDNGDRYKTLPDGSIHRIVKSAEIYEIGPVTNPAYEQTEVGLRNKEFFNQLLSTVDNKNHNDNEIRVIKEFLQKRKGL